MSSDWDAPWLRCAMTEMWSDWDEQWLRCAVTEMCHDWDAQWLRCAVTEMLTKSLIYAKKKLSQTTYNAIYLFLKWPSDITKALAESCVFIQQILILFTVPSQKFYTIHNKSAWQQVTNYFKLKARYCIPGFTQVWPYSSCIQLLSLSLFAGDLDRNPISHCRFTALQGRYDFIHTKVSSSIGTTS